MVDGYKIVGEISKKLLIWRLKALSSLNDDGSAVLKLVHEEMLPSPSPFFPLKCFVSEKYIVTCLMRPSQNDIDETQTVHRSSFYCQFRCGLLFPRRMPDNRNQLQLRKRPFCNPNGVLLLTNWIKKLYQVQLNQYFI